MKKITLFILTLVAITTLSACKSENPEQASQYRSSLTGQTAAAKVTPLNLEGSPIEFKEEKLSPELLEAIKERMENYKDFRYLTQLAQYEGVRWIDLKREETKSYFPEFDNGYTYIESALVSPDGKYLAMNMTQGENSKWSKVVIINTEKNTYITPFDDNAAYKVPEGSECSEITIVEVKSKAELINPCIVETPKSVYLLDFWSDNETLELIKKYHSSNTLYSVNLRK